MQPKINPERSPLEYSNRISGEDREGEQTIQMKKIAHPQRDFDRKTLMRFLQIKL